MYIVVLLRNSRSLAYRLRLSFINSTAAIRSRRLGAIKIAEFFGMEEKCDRFRLSDERVWERLRASRLAARWCQSHAEAENRCTSEVDGRDLGPAPT